jgi:hypothetical protein
VAARDQTSVQTFYAATIGEVDEAGEPWEHVSRDAGRGLATRVHGVGDGAPWIAQQCLRRLEPDVGYLLDLFHACDYLAQVWPARPRMLRRHRQHLQVGAVHKMLAALRRRLEPKELAPARRALRYLQNRPDQLDYPQTLRASLPVGPGMIKSGHRHVLPHRLELAGAWWLPEHLKLMGPLRTTRANGRFDAYWSRN